MFKNVFDINYEGEIKGMNRKIALVISFALVISMLSACGTKEADETSSDIPASSEVTTSANETDTSSQIAQSSIQTTQTSTQTTSEASTSTETLYGVPAATCAPATNETLETDSSKQEKQSGNKVIKPMAPAISVKNFKTGTALAQIKPETIVDNGDGTLTIQFDVYERVRYDAKDIDGMKVGDSIEFRGDTVKIESFVKQYDYLINGGGENGTGEGFDLCQSEDGTYTQDLSDYGGNYMKDGTVTLKTAPDFVYSATDFDGNTHTSDAAGLTQLITTDGLTEEAAFECTKITVKNGALETLVYDCQI